MCTSNTERETRYKTMIWELMREEYLEEQAAKNASAAAGTSIDGVEPGKEKKQRRVGDRGEEEYPSPAALHFSAEFVTGFAGW